MASVSDLSVMLFPWGLERPSVPEIVEAAKLAEDLGFYSVTMPTHMTLPPGWLFETYQNQDVLDALAIVPVIAAATKRIKIALMAMSPYSIHPVYAAMAAATLAELHPGRIVLSLGVGAPGDLAAAGIETPKPLQTLEEAIDICRGLFAGDAVTHAGEVFRLSGRRLEGGSCVVPIVLAASGPRMLELAGGRADGVIVSGATSVPFVRWCRERSGPDVTLMGT